MYKCIVLFFFFWIKIYKTASFMWRHDMTVCEEGPFHLIFSISSLMSVHSSDWPCCLIEWIAACHCWREMRWLHPAFIHRSVSHAPPRSFSLAPTPASDPVWGSKVGFLLCTLLERNWELIESLLVCGKELLLRCDTYYLHKDIKIHLFCL